MDTLVLELASGRPLLISLAVLLVVLLVDAGAPWASRRWHLVKIGIAITAVVTIAVSSPPSPALLLALFATSFGLWIVVTLLCRHLRRKPRAWCGLPLVAAAACLLTHELAWLRGPNLEGFTSDRIVVMGDSVSAGVGGRETPWPELLADQRGVRVDNHARAGARVADALALQLPEVEAGPALVLLEIGGNDLLAGVPLDRFERDLDTLLALLPGQKGRLYVMLELPTPPFHGGYARIQRRLAERHGVYMIPRHAWLRVIRDPNATLDGIHLTPVGHAAMAEMIGDWIGTSLVPAP